jgi:hypothetical protein
MKAADEGHLVAILVAFETRCSTSDAERLVIRLLKVTGQPTTPFGGGAVLSVGAFSYGAGVPCKRNK